MSENLVIRKFEPRDQEVVAQLYREGMHESYKESPDIKACTSYFADTKLKHPDGDMSNIQKHFMEKPRSCFFVAELDGQIVGIVGAIPSTEFSPDTYCELVRMSVSSNCRGKGIGARLIVAFEDWARENGYTHANLTTLEEMHLAMNLYTKNNYQLVKNIEGQYACRGEAPPITIHVAHFVKRLVDC